jgi:hypothetical protein
MNIEEKTKVMRKFGKALGNVVFVVHVKSGVARVKLGKKIVVVNCPDLPAAERLADGLNHVLRSNQEQTDLILDLLDKKCEQLTLETILFPKEEKDEATGLGDQPEGPILDTVGDVGGGCDTTEAGLQQHTGPGDIAVQRESA